MDLKTQEMICNMNINKKILDLFFITPYYAEQHKDGQFFVARSSNSISSDNPKGDETITRQKIELGLKGEMVIGVYSTSRNNECKWLVLDFDASSDPGDIKLLSAKVIEYYRRAINYHLKPYIEFSGMKGYHLWVFFNPMSSETVYKAVSMLGKDIEGEIFPRQSHLTNGASYGNLIRMPGCINRKSGKPSVWLNSNMQPAANQEDFFMSLEKTSQAYIYDLASLHPEIPVAKKVLQSVRYNIDISHSLYEITKDKTRHFAQFSLIMKGLEAGLNDDAIIELGKRWLEFYKGHYKSDFDYALEDFKKGLSYCRETYGK
jgi:hypothetical protein